jgi:hypothetical protein
MADLQQLKRRIVHTAQRLVVNPVGRLGSDLLTIRVDLG